MTAFALRRRFCAEALGAALLLAIVVGSGIMGERLSSGVAGLALLANTLATAAGLAATHKLGIWDAVMLASAASAGCRLLLSEDLQGGFTWDGVTVVDPFVSAPHPLLSAILAD